MKKHTYPVSAIGVATSELPGEVAVYIEFSGCTQNCPECHSQHLIGEQGDSISLEDLVYNVYAITECYPEDITAIVLMGGTANLRMTNKKLLALLKALYKKTRLPIGIYSGKDEDLDEWVSVKEVSWLKTGSYKKELGGLEVPTTNQKIYERTVDYNVLDAEGFIDEVVWKWRDITGKFQEGANVVKQTN